LVTFVLQEAQRECDALKFAEPSRCLGLRVPCEEVGVDLLEAIEHDRVHMQHRAADAAVFVFASSGVGAPAAAEFDLPLVEVGFELIPLLAGDGAVLAGRSSSAARGEVGLVVADDVFVEDGDVAVRGL